MKRRWNKIPLIIALSILIFLSAFILLSKQNSADTFTGSAVFTPPVPSSCSNSEISTLWDSIFKESSAGITIVSSTAETGKCSAFLAYKIQGQRAYWLTGLDTTSLNQTKILATDGNFSTAYLSLIKNITAENVQNSNVNLTNYVTYAASRSIPAINSANDTFISKFKPIPTNWILNTTSSSTYYFADSEASSGYTKWASGYVLSNYVVDSSLFLKVGITSSCSPNWTAVKGSCGSDEIINVSFRDSNSCGPLSGMPANYTEACDNDGNGIIGSESSITATNINLSLYISSQPLNLSTKYNVSYKVEFKDSNISRVEFNYDFSKPLNLKNISLIKQDSSSSFGYVLVNGLDVAKKVRVDKLNSESYFVCIKDTSVGNINEINKSCSETDETLVNCLDNSGSFQCSMTGSIFEVSGLLHSGVREIITSDVINMTTCIVSWNCSAWSSCANNIRTRACVNITSLSCAGAANKPNETESCTPTLPSCTPLWSNCSAWTPEKCSLGQNQTRTCTDSNKCDSNNLQQTQKRACENPAKASNKGIIIIISVIVTVIAASIFVFYLLTKKEDKNEVLIIPPAGYPSSPPVEETKKPSLPPPATPQFQPNLSPKPEAQQQQPASAKPAAQPAQQSNPNTEQSNQKKIF